MENEDLVNFDNFTFHRHSCPKNIIYFRCSDKKCPAKLHYNKLTKQILLKNEHLDILVHKPCKSNKLIDLRTKLQQDQNARKSTYVAQPKQSLDPFPMAYDFNNDKYLVRFYVTQKSDAKSISIHATRGGFANKSLILEHIEIVNEHGITTEDVRCLVELETTYQHLDLLCTEIRRCFKIPPEIIILKTI